VELFFWKNRPNLHLYGGRVHLYVFPSMSFQTAGVTQKKNSNCYFCKLIARIFRRRFYFWKT